jgi:hypothetical protein
MDINELNENDIKFNVKFVWRTQTLLVQYRNFNSKAGGTHKQNLCLTFFNWGRQIIFFFLTNL